MRPAAPVTAFGPPARRRPPRTRLGRAVDAVVAPLAATLTLAGAIAVLAVTRLNVGVKVQTGTAPGAPDRGLPVGATFYVAGLAERGDTVGPIEVRSMSDYRLKLGNRVSYGYLYDQLETFFAEGGVLANVARVVGPAAITGTKVLVDRAGAPLNTLTLTAKNAGAWSANLDVEVANGNVADTFTITLYVDDVVLEVYEDLATPAAAAIAINAGSELVTAVDNGSATAAPNNNPAVLAAAAFSAGTDDRASVVAADYVAALARFTDKGGIVAIPGQTSANVGAGLEAHAKAFARVYAAATAIAQSQAQAQAAALARRNANGAEHGGLFWPWVKTPDGAGGTRTIPPEGYVAAMRTRALRESGPWRAPAGDIARARFVVGVETELTAEQVDDAVAARVNPIITKAGGIRLYGWRSLSTDAANYRQLTGRDTLNLISIVGADDLEEFVFDTFDGDGRKLSAVYGKLDARLAPMREAGGLFARIVDGNEVDPGYVIDLSGNTPETLAADEVHAKVGARVSPTGETIFLDIVKVPVDSSL